MKCQSKLCVYEWEPRIERPKRCPKCMRWQKYTKALKSKENSLLPTVTQADAAANLEISKDLP